jgi:ferredoxin
MIQDLLDLEDQRTQALVSARLVAEHGRCVECGMCSYNCPIGFDIRKHVQQGKSISDDHCLACGECVSRCPRGVLHFERSEIFSRESGW